MGQLEPGIRREEVGVVGWHQELDRGICNLSSWESGIGYSGVGERQVVRRPLLPKPERGLNQEGGGQCECKTGEVRVGLWQLNPKYEAGKGKESSLGNWNKEVVYGIML